MDLTGRLQLALDVLGRENLSNDDKIKAVAEGLREALKEVDPVKEFDFREIADNMYDGIYITDGEARTLFVNQAYTRITGIKPEEVVGESVADISERGIWKNAVSPEVIRTRRQVNSIAEATRTGAKMLVTGNPIFDSNNRVKNVVVIDRDITDHLAMQSELEATKEKIKAVENDTDKNKFEIEVLRKMHLGGNFIGCSAQVQEIARLIRQVADLDVTVLIIGETGTGKEIVANEIYSSSKRHNGPFIKVNCAAIPANLLESELFGYQKGAFTGASNRGRIGMFELANKGTLLLDEIGEMPIDVQAKLLRAIQNKEIYRLGGNQPISLDVRIIAATNRDLKTLVGKGAFREDLYYRLNILPIFIPPLRMRVDDIGELARHFLDKYNAKYDKRAILDFDAIEMMKTYPWPGNVREMQNIIERIIIVCDRDVVIGPAMVAHLLNVNPSFSQAASRGHGLKDIVANAERSAIERALADCGSTREAAKTLKISQSNVVRKAKRLGIRLAERSA